MGDNDFAKRLIRSEAALLFHVLDKHPATLDLANLANYFASDPTDRLEVEEIEMMSRCLAGSGLLYLIPMEQPGDTGRTALSEGNKVVVPSQAALRFQELSIRAG